MYGIVDLSRVDESIVLAAVVRRGHQLRVEELQGLAREIRSEIVAAWNKGQGK
jgi:hypothetical protein